MEERKRREDVKVSLNRLRDALNLPPCRTYSTPRIIEAAIKEINQLVETYVCDGNIVIKVLYIRVISERMLLETITALKHRDGRPLPVLPDHIVCEQH